MARRGGSIGAASPVTARYGKECTHTCTAVHCVQHYTVMYTYAHLVCTTTKRLHLVPSRFNTELLIQKQLGRFKVLVIYAVIFNGRGASVVHACWMMFVR